MAVRADGSAQKDVRSSDLTDGTLHYSFTLLGQSAKDARIVSASYTTPYSGSGALDKAGGTLALETPQDRDSQRYTVTLTAEVTEGGETRMVLFTIYLDYKNNDDLSLELTWYRGGVTAERVTCAKDAGAAAKIKQNQLINGSFSYHLALTGANAEKAKLLSARLTGPGLDQTMQESGSAVLEHAFDFLETAFGDSQEMVIFLTGLNMSEAAVAFLQTTDCERYERYNKRLLFNESDREIRDEIARLK